MIRSRRIALMLILLLLCSGCASNRFRPARLPQAVDPAAQEEARSERIVAVGSTVEVTLSGGDTLTGTLIEITPQHVVVGGNPDFHSGETTVDVDEIESISEKYATTLERFSVVTLVVVTSVLVGGTLAALGSLQ